MLCDAFFNVFYGTGFQSALDHLKPQLSDDTQKTAVEQLIERLVPEVAGNFSITIDSNFTKDGKECFKVVQSITC